MAGVFNDGDLRVRRDEDEGDGVLRAPGADSSGTEKKTTPRSALDTSAGFRELSGRTCTRPCSGEALGSSSGSSQE